MNKKFHRDNIVVGLISNMLRKNRLHDNEYFTLFDDKYFKVRISFSGFDQSIVENSLVELSTNGSWFETEKETYYATDIQNIELNVIDKIVDFLVQKELLISLRDDLLK